MIDNEAVRYGRIAAIFGAILGFAMGVVVTLSFMAMPP